MSKIHWIRKHKGYNNFTNKPCWYYDLIAACGRRTILNSTVIRCNVKCKTCLKIMNKKRG